MSDSSSGQTDTTLALVRHGETTWVADGRFQGSSDPPLSELGQRQAAAVGRRLTDRHAPPALPLPPGAPVGIWHSPLARAASTAGAILAARETSVPMHPEPGLRELAQGEWEGHTQAEVIACWPDELAAWRADPMHHHAPRGEPVVDAAARAATSVEHILAAIGGGLRGSWTGDTVSRSQVLGYVDPTAGGPGDVPEPLIEPWALIVAHDGILRLVLMHLLDLSLDHYWELPFGLCSITVVEIRAGRARLRAHNLGEYLPE